MLCVNCALHGTCSSHLKALPNRDTTCSTKISKWMNGISLASLRIPFRETKNKDSDSYTKTHSRGKDLLKSHQPIIQPELWPRKCQPYFWSDRPKTTPLKNMKSIVVQNVETGLVLHFWFHSTLRKKKLMAQLVCSSENAVFRASFSPRSDTGGSKFEPGLSAAGK